MPVLWRAARPDRTRLPPLQRVPALNVLTTLAEGEIEVEGRLVEASNLALRVFVGDERVRAIYKPVRGERELWDFPDGTLAGRERATYVIAAAGGWPHIPETVLREGPFGVGALQRWVGPVDTRPVQSLVRIDPPVEVPEGFLPVVGAETGGGPVIVSHADDPRLASLAVLDVVLNNTDRKASHLIEDGEELWAIDHGITCHAEPKLRTVLWGWAGDPLPDNEIRRLHRLADGLEDEAAEELAGLLTPVEIEAVRGRVAGLLEAGVFPDPVGERYPLPWPLW